MPLGCSFQGDGRFVIVASSGGSPTRPDWYYNLKANSRITVEVGAQTFTVLADELAGAARAELLAEAGRGVSHFGEHQARTTRQFPVFMLTRQGLTAARAAADPQRHRSARSARTGGAAPGSRSDP